MARPARAREADPVPVPDYQDADTAAIEHTAPTPAMRAGFKAIVEHDRALYGEAHVDALKAEVAALVREDFATARGYCEQYGEWCSQQVLVRRKRIEALFAGLTDEIIADNVRRAEEKLLQKEVTGNV